MVQVVKGLAIVTVICAFIVGILDFQWETAIIWWVSGIVSGILIFAFGVVIEHLENISYALNRGESDNRYASSDLRKPAPTGSLGKLQGYTMSNSDDKD
ncbi:hypothetical protein [Paenibacillus sp. GCM10027626]|uniref:hypothetical protein n=1 Tax=Paenibacillus sp. GCM10027626 TaxID=3273411 RepID=UPI00363A1E32